MKKVLAAFLVLFSLIVLGAGFLVGRWLVRHQDPLSFIPQRYVAFVQVPSLRTLYDDWLNLPAADVILSRPELRPYQGALADARGLALTRSRFMQKLLDVPADVVLLPDRKLLAVMDLGWRGILSPLARVVGPLLSLKGFSFLNDAGLPMYRYTSGSTTIQAALVENVAILSLDESVVKDALARSLAGQGLASTASRDLLRRLRPRADRAVRILVDTRGLSGEMLAGSGPANAVLAALQPPDQSIISVEARSQGLRLSAELPISPTLPELSAVLSQARQPVGVLRYVPSTSYLLSIINLAPLGDLYRLAAVAEGANVQDIFKKADDGARSVLGAGIDQLVFSWVGSEVGAFLLPSSNAPVYFARISDPKACAGAIAKLTGSLVAGKDSSLVLDGVRVDRIFIPWYVAMILSALGVDVPEPYFLIRGDYFFASLDPGNLASVAKTADTGDNVLSTGSFPRLTERIPADSSLMLWYDSTRAQPFFLAGSGILPEVLRVYSAGLVVMRASPSRLDLTLVTSGASMGAAQPLPGFPLAVDGGVSGDLLAFRFSDSGPALLAWIRDGSFLELADAGAARIAEAKLEKGSVMVPEVLRPGVLSAIWAVSPGGTVWRFGPKLAPSPGFPVATAIASPMPPTLVGGKLALFSRADSSLVLVGPDGGRSTFGDRVEASLFAPPDSLGNRIAFYPKSFDARIHLRDLSGAEAPGWPVSASGISFCSPRFVSTPGGFLVTFLTQAGQLYAWDPSGSPVPSFPISLPGVFFATPAALSVDGQGALAVLAQDGTLSIVGMNGTVLRQTAVPDMDGKDARILVADLYRDGSQEILLYGSGAFIAGYDSSLRPLPGFPLKGVSAPQLVDLNHDGPLDLVTAGLDGKVYAYALRKGPP